MKISREIKAAVLVISGIALFIYLFTFLRGNNLFVSTDVYYTEFDYNALNPSAPVTVKGNKIGKVEEIKYDFESGKTKVSFSVDPKLEFSKNSTVRLYQTSLMGGNALSIIDANDGVRAKPGDFISSGVKPGLVSTLEDDFSGISNDLGTTLRKTDTLFTSINTLVEDDSEAGLKNAIAELSTTLKSFNRLSGSFDKLIKTNEAKISAVLDNFEKTSAELTILMKELNSSNISGTLKDFDDTLIKINSLVSDLNAGKGSVGKLLKDETLYNNLDNASKELELLLLDIKLHPARYRRILSKREIPYEEPTPEQLNKN